MSWVKVNFHSIYVIFFFKDKKKRFKVFRVDDGDLKNDCKNDVKDVLNKSETSSFEMRMRMRILSVGEKETETMPHFLYPHFLTCLRRRR